MDGRAYDTRDGVLAGARVGAPEYEGRAAEAVAAEFAADRPASGSLAGGVFDGEAFDQGGFDQDGFDQDGYDSDRFGEHVLDGDAGRAPARVSAARGTPRQGVSERAPLPDAEPAEQSGASVAEPAEAAARATENVREALPPRRKPRRNTQLGTQDAERMIDLRTKGRTYREIAEEVGVSRSTVGKRMREFTETGSIPVVKPR